jgi:hypothetical protein
MTIKRLTSGQDAEVADEKLSPEQMAVEELRTMRDLWPEDDSLDELLARRHFV